MKNQPLLRKRKGVAGEGGRRTIGSKPRHLDSQVLTAVQCAQRPLSSGDPGLMRQNAALVAFALAVLVVPSRCEEGAGATTATVAVSKPGGIAGYHPVCHPLQLLFVGG